MRSARPFSTLRPATAAGPSTSRGTRSSGIGGSGNGLGQARQLARLEQALQHVGAAGRDRHDRQVARGIEHGGEQRAGRPSRSAGAAIVNTSSNWSIGSSSVAARASPTRRSFEQLRRSASTASGAARAVRASPPRRPASPSCCAIALASASSGALSGRIGGSTIQCAPPARELRQHAGLEQRRLAGARRADDHQKPRAALRAPGVEPLDHRARLVVAAEIDRRVLGLEGVDAGIGRPVRIEREAARQLVGDRAAAAARAARGRPRSSRCRSTAWMSGSTAVAERRADDRQDHLAERARLRQLGEAPLRGHPVRREHQDDGVAARQFLVEPLLPVLAGADAALLVEIEEDALEAEPASDALMSSDVFWSRLEWLMKIAGMGSRQSLPSVPRLLGTDVEEHHSNFVAAQLWVEARIWPRLVNGFCLKCPRAGRPTSTSLTNASSPRSPTTSSLEKSVDQQGGAREVRCR